MIKFVMGLIIGVILMPTINEIRRITGFEHGIRNMLLKHPLDFIKEVLNSAFNGWY